MHHRHMAPQEMIENPRVHYEVMKMLDLTMLQSLDDNALLFDHLLSRQTVLSESPQLGRVPPSPPHRHALSTHSGNDARSTRVRFLAFSTMMRAGQMA